MEKTEAEVQKVVRHGLVEVVVESFRARIAADLVEGVVERLQRQGFKVVVIAKEHA